MDTTNNLLHYLLFHFETANPKENLQRIASIAAILTRSAVLPLFPFVIGEVMVPSLCSGRPYGLDWHALTRLRRPCLARTWEANCQSRTELGLV